MTISKSNGRPKMAGDLKKAPLFVNIPQWMIAWLRSQPSSNAELIERALIETHGLTHNIDPYIDDPL